MSEHKLCMLAVGGLIGTTLSAYTLVTSACSTIFLSAYYGHNSIATNVSYYVFTISQVTGVLSAGLGVCSFASLALKYGRRR